MCGPLVTGGGVDVGGCCLAPAGRWRAAVEGLVLLAVKQVEHGAGNACEAGEVPDAGRVDVDPANAAEVGHHVADAGAAAVEAARAAAETAEQVEVTDLAPVE